MNPFLLKQVVGRLRNRTHKYIANYFAFYCCNELSSFPRVPALLSHQSSFHSAYLPWNQSFHGQNFLPYLTKFVHSLQVIPTTESDGEVEELDEEMNEFLSRFVHLFRNNLVEAYPTCDKETVDRMLLLIVQRVISEMEKGSLDQMIDSTTSSKSLDLSQDLWKTIWEVSHMVLEDMKKDLKRKQMKHFLQSEDVKEMCRFASDVGIRGDMLRELRFKWASEKLEESEFYNKIMQFEHESRDEDQASETKEAAEEEAKSIEGKPKVSTLPKRRGKIKYKIYGLDLSRPEWAEVADRIAEAERNITPEEPKEITGKCKVVTDKILSLKAEEDPYALLAEWVELLHPERVDWLALLTNLKDCSRGLYLKVAEHILNEETFKADIYDFSKLIDEYAKEDRVEDAERILQKMSDKRIIPDALLLNILVHMYSNNGNLEQAKNAFEQLKSQGFKADLRLYRAMIMAYVKAGEPKPGELLMREMERKGIKPSKEIYMGLLKTFSEKGLKDGAQKIFTAMNFAGFEPDLESCTLLVEAYGNAGDSDQARKSFDEMRTQVGKQPDDRCTAGMIAAYEKKNFLDMALNLLLDLEKDGFKPGLATYSVFVEWLGKLQLVDEVEQLLGKIRDMGKELPFKLHVSLCYMYSTAGNEKKAFEELRILESKKELLTAVDYERIINGFVNCGLVKEAQRIYDLMQDQGFPAKEDLKVSIMVAQVPQRNAPTVNWTAVRSKPKRQ